MELFKVDSLDETINKLYKVILENNYSLSIEEIDIKNSLDRILKDDIVSNIDVPEFDRSIVDGYAVVATDTQGATDTIPTFLDIVGESKMGKVCDISIESGSCIYVPTGAMLPKNATACVMIEHTENITDNKIAIYEPVADGVNVVKCGDDIKKGTIILYKGKKISPADIGVLSSLGINKIKVYKKPTLTIISTGDELIDENEKYSFGKIRDINSNLLLSLSKKYGLDVLNKFLLKDDENLLLETLKYSMKNSDIVVISGGSSKGKKDVTSFVIDKLTSSGILTHGIAIKPGKPTITSYDANTNTIVVGLPGHPIASAILFRLLIVDLYYKLANANIKPFSCQGMITENISSSAGRMTFQLVEVDDSFNVKPIYGKSGLIHTLSKATGYIIIDKNNEGINKGDIVKVYYL